MQTLSDADELAVLQAQLLQWSYLNARADHAAQAQEETVRDFLARFSPLFGCVDHVSPPECALKPKPNCGRLIRRIYGVFFHL